LRYNSITIYDKIGGIIAMLKEFMWNLFQKTGSITSYMTYKEFEKREASSFKGNSLSSDSNIPVENK